MGRLGLALRRFGVDELDLEDVFVDLVGEGPPMNGFAPSSARSSTRPCAPGASGSLPGFLLFSALSSPLVTYLMPTLLDQPRHARSRGSASPSPTPRPCRPTSSTSATSSQLTLFALVIAYGGIVSGEVRGGTAALTLAKPLSRAAFVTGKWLSQAAVVVVGRGAGHRSSASR